MERWVGFSKILADGKGVIDAEVRIDPWLGRLRVAQDQDRYERGW
jgi:hypothetical protein